MLHAHDERAHVMYFRVISPEIGDDAWSFYTTAFEQHMVRTDDPPYAIVIEVEVGSGTPGAKWRKRFADIGARVRPDAVFVVIAKSPLARAVVTTVNWIRPFGFHYGVVGTRAEAIDLVLRHRHEPGLRDAIEALAERAVPIPRA